MSEKKRFVILLDNEKFEQFKKLAQMENRPTGNLAVKLILDYIKEHEKEL